VVSSAQLRGVGLGAAAVHGRVQSGRLLHVRRNVYAVGWGPSTPEARWMSAVLACGPGAMLSHLSAAHLWELLEDRGGPVHLTVPGRRGRKLGGLCVHRAGSLRPEDSTSFRGIPCTSPARTILDLAAVVGAGWLRRAIGEAEVLGIVDLGDLRRQIAVNRGRRGVARLGSILSEIDPQTSRTRSELERRFLGICARAGLPKPRVNGHLRIDGIRFEGDFIWDDPKVLVEADGRRFHSTRTAFERDRRRDQRLIRSGWQVVRFTWRQVVDEPSYVSATVTAILSHGQGFMGPQIK
jgi:very-short-patch-repair endonuclease